MRGCPHSTANVNVFAVWTIALIPQKIISLLVNSLRKLVGHGRYHKPPVPIDPAYQCGRWWRLCMALAPMHATEYLKSWAGPIRLHP